MPSMVGARVLIRELRENDVEQTLEFLNAVFHGWGGYRQWSWKFKAVEAVTGRQSTCFVVEHDGRIVGHLACIPVNARVSGKVVPACQLVDGAIDARYKGKGVYTNLVRTVLTKAGEKNNGLIFGFANEAAFHNYSRHSDLLALCRVTKMVKVLGSRHSLNSLKVRFVEREAKQSRKDLNTTRFVERNALILLRQLVKIVPILGASFVKQCLGSHGNDRSADIKRGLSVVERRDFNKVEKFWIEFSRQISFAVERSSGFLEWRYSRPEMKYRVFFVEKSGFPIGYFIIGQEEKSVGIGNVELAKIRIGCVMDLISKAETAGLLLLIAEEELRKQNSLIAQFWTREESAAYNMLRLSGYDQLPDEITIVAKAHEPRYEPLLLNSQEGIIVSSGDTDHA